MWPGFRGPTGICVLLLLPKPGDTFSVSFASLSSRFRFPFWESPKKAPVDPCASASEPEKCHYNQAINLLAHMNSVPSASQVPMQSSTHDTVNMIAPVFGSKATPHPPVALRATGVAVKADGGKHHQNKVDPAATGPAAEASTDKEYGHQLDPAIKEEQSVALILALGALEGEELPAHSLERATIQLEDELDKLQPGALTSFRARRLAEAMNHHGPPKPADKRASEALAALEQVNWSSSSVVTNVIRDLQSEEKSKSVSLFQWVADANAQSSGQLFVLFVFVLSIVIMERWAQEAAFVPIHEELRYGAMGLRQAH